MKRILVLFVVLALAALFVFGCAKQDYQYPTGAAAYDGQQNQPQGYIGGGCGVAPASDSGDVQSDVSETALAA
jgi:hypothetical protein|tara:strand:- start:2087 stop:2305 length:219 start_codon:yes stop_codon:yes gene_type:complete